MTFEREPFASGDVAADERLSRDVAGSVSVSDSPMRRYLAARTRFFDRVVVRALDQGVTQIVIGAAGYDGRALRYATPNVQWFEVDHPDTQRDKRERLTELGIDTTHISFVAADFTVDSVADGLEQAGFDRQRAAVFTLEGVAVYLDRAVLDTVMQQLRLVAADNSRLAISLSVDRVNGETAARRESFRSAVAAMGEPARTHLAGEEVEPFLTNTGWRELAGNERARAAGLVVAEPA